MEYHHQSFDIIIVITKQTRLQNAYAVIFVLLQSARKGPTRRIKLFHCLEKTILPMEPRYERIPVAPQMYKHTQRDKAFHLGDSTSPRRHNIDKQPESTEKDNYR